MDYTRAFNAFFGTNPSILDRNVIITNINPVFYGLMEKSTVEHPIFKGFYELTKVTYKSGVTYDLIKVSSGNNIIDVLKLVTMYVHNVIFVGIAGSLNSDCYIGDVYCPSEFINGICPNYDYQNTICQTTGLIQSDEFYRDLKEAGVSFVDMECFDVYTLCQKNNISLKYIIQVSDTPLERPFYDATPETIKIDTIIDIINGTK